MPGLEPGLAPLGVAVVAPDPLGLVELEPDPEPAVGREPPAGRATATDVAVLCGLRRLVRSFLLRVRRSRVREAALARVIRRARADRSARDLGVLAASRIIAVAAGAVLPRLVSIAEEEWGVTSP